MGVDFDLITGAPTGVTYIGASSYHDDFMANMFPASRTLTSNALMVSQRPGPSYRSYMLIHKTYDTTGNLAAVTRTLNTQLA